MPSDFGPAASPRQTSGRATVAANPRWDAVRAGASHAGPRRSPRRHRRRISMQVTAPSTLCAALLTGAVRDAQSDGVSLDEFIGRVAQTWYAVAETTIDGTRIAEVAVRVVLAERDGDLARLLFAVTQLAEALDDSALLP